MKELTTAQKIHQLFGMPIADSKRAHGNKNPSYTKRGPGRYPAKGRAHV